MSAEQSNERVKGPVLVRFAERWQAESVLELCDMDNLDETILEALRAALDSPPVETEQEITRVEIQYRVRGTERRTGCVWIGEARAKQPTPEHMFGVRDRNRDVRVESRTVSTLADGSSLTSPWVELPSEEGER
jgi:hypothetical protein